MAGATASIQIDGVKDAIKHLNKCEPGYRKLFTAHVKDIAKPVTSAMQSNYDDMRFPSGTKRGWSPGGRQIFPLTATKSKRGVGVRVSTKRKAATLSIYQSNAGATIFDMAGRNVNNKLASAFNTSFGRRASRVMWPAFETNEKALVGEIYVVIEELIAETNRNLKVF